MSFKSIIRCTLLMSLISWYGYQIVHGKNGLKEYFELKEQLQKEEASVAKLNQEIAQIKKHIYVVETNKFIKEKIAREELLLGLNNEHVYFVNNTKT